MRAGRARHGASPWCLAAAALAAVSSSPRWSRAWGLGLPSRAARPGGARARVRCRYEEPHDAFDRWDIQSGGREVGFSKHKHLTYEEALEQEPGFCNWVVQESQKEDASEMLMDFAQWLQGQGVSDFNDGLVGFGKRAHLTYEEAMDQEPGFCNWVLRESQKEDASGMLMDFAQWLQGQGFSSLNADDGLVGFGKHAHLTYEEALNQEPGYCSWVLEESQKGDAKQELMDFAQWLQEQGATPFADGLVGFARHAHLTYKEALDQEPSFCDWVLRESQKEDASERLMVFAQWLKDRGVEIEHSEGGKNLARQDEALPALRVHGDGGGDDEERSGAPDVEALVTPKKAKAKANAKVKAKPKKEKAGRKAQDKQQTEAKAKGGIEEPAETVLSGAGSEGEHAEQQQSKPKKAKASKAKASKASKAKKQKKESEPESQS